LQLGLLEAASRTVKPGGTLVYAVCTLTNEETLGADDWARVNLTDLDAAARPPAPWRPHGRGAILLPSDAGTDGMFVLRLVRHA
jgi:16S rRNA (cytosine967-C5)-methyltransferase